MTDLKSAFRSPRSNDPNSIGISINLRPLTSFSMPYAPCSMPTYRLCERQKRHLFFSTILTESRPSIVSPLTVLPFKIALFITDLETGQFCPEEEDEISQSVLVDIFATPQEKSFAVLIACPSKRDGIPVHLTGCIETMPSREWRQV